MITVGLFHQRSGRKRFYSHHTQSFVLCDVVENSEVGYQQAIVCSRRKAYTQWTGTLPSGSYVLIPFSASYWHRPRQIDDETKFTLVIHSFTQLDLVIVEESGKLLADSLISAVIKSSHTPKKVSRIPINVKKVRRPMLKSILVHPKTTHFLNYTQ
jgi:hypothetical protein